ncbi:MAG: hypothetical protein M0P64_02775 [Candidatus Pacebacteria bacterium]|jgi:hypothetical protein|nr:hypothetical protein [Candidatus Paceibacterota bacterium]
MKGAVPQKGLKMLKLSITQGPIINGEDVGFAISLKHIKEISNFLCEWYEAVPSGIAKHIEVIRVVPSNGKHKYARVLIEVILSGDSSRVGVTGISDGFILTPWKSSIGYCFYSYDSSMDILDGDARREVEKELNERLASAICQQLESHQAQHKYFDSLFRQLEGAEKSIL